MSMVESESYVDLVAELSVWAKRFKQLQCVEYESINATRLMQ